jgi:cephalosporin-C deacetylase-like acetyl esterase
MVSEVQFPGAEGERLAGTLVVPDGRSRSLPLSS